MDGDVTSGLCFISSANNSLNLNPNANLKKEAVYNSSSLVDCKKMATLRWGIGTALILCVGLMGMGCQKKADERIRIAIEHFPRTLDPRLAQDTYGVRISGLIFS